MKTGYWKASVKLMGLLLIFAVSSVSAFKADEEQAIENHSNTDISESMQIEAQACPESFYDISLPSGGKLCQVFAADFPASMIFFVPTSPEEVVNFYKNDSTQFTNSKQVKDRFMLQTSDKNTTLIISADGEGSQVDVLIKAI
ncbi:hypothetical protein [Glaciecola petra]|uniref:Uncharacterized protein n=1 Tax=Glaciecola petra TaxID=3075602 RepID=A0ABU2ZUL2_9ALTE|nr:hypothetical protein [Aestuariibacter sp. P117]MDT0596004.1 hypothetical protein [Aestuariibacter sp. P117]